MYIYICVYIHNYISVYVYTCMYMYVLFYTLYGVYSAIIKICGINKPFMLQAH